MLIIEFIGPPYSGKSFYKDDLYENLKKKNIDTKDYKKNFLLNVGKCYKLNLLEKFLFFLASKKGDNSNRKNLKPKSNYSVKKFNLFRDMQIKRKNKVFFDFQNENKNFVKIVENFKSDLNISEERSNDLNRWFKDLCVSYEVLKKMNKKDQIVMDSEGFIHRLNSFIITNNNKTFVDEYLLHCPKPDILILVNENPEICLERLRSQKNLEEIKKYENNLHSFYQNSENIFNQVKKKISKSFVINSKNYNKIKKEIVKSIIDEKL